MNKNPTERGTAPLSLDSALSLAVSALPDGFSMAITIDPSGPGDMVTLYRNGVQLANAPWTEKLLPELVFEMAVYADQLAQKGGAM